MTTATKIKTGKATKETKRKAAKEKALEINTAGMKLLGEIITWNARTTTVHTRTSIVAALKAADLTEELCKELLARHAFSRACKKLTEDRLIDVVREDGDFMWFQLTKKSLEQVDSSDPKAKEWAYTKETFLKLDKNTGMIECKSDSLRKFAQAELDRCREERTTSDITKIVQKLFEGQADLVPVRDQGGVYFVPIQYIPFVEKVSNFLGLIGGKISRFPVPAGTQLGNKAVQESVSEYLEGLIQEHEFAVDDFTLNTRKDTIEHAAERIKATRLKVEAYADYLQDRAKDLLASVDEANEKLLAQIENLDQKRKELPESNGEGGAQLWMGFSMTAVIRWMGKESWNFEQARKALDKHGMSCADATIRAQLQAGKTGKRGEPAKLTPAQISMLD